MSGPLGLDSAFWASEAKCLLLLRNNEFFTAQNAQERCEQFSDLVAKINDAEKYAAFANAEAKPTGSAEFDRIFREDAVRTFTAENYREAEVRTLYKVFAYTKDYHQGLGFIVAFLRLFLSEAQTVTVCCALNDTACQGYFKLENEQYLKDVYIFDALLESKTALSWHGDAALADFLTCLNSRRMKLKEYTFSGQYVSKWFIGLCIHVFPFAGIYELLSTILDTPEKTTWYKIGAAIIAAAADDLDRADSTSELIKVLKFDRDLYADDLTIARLRPSLLQARSVAVSDEDATANADAGSSSEEETTQDWTETNAFVWIIQSARHIEIDQSELAAIETKVCKVLEAQKLARERAASADNDEESFNFSDED